MVYFAIQEIKFFFVLTENTFSKEFQSLKVLFSLCNISSQSSDVLIRILFDIRYSNFSSSIKVKFVTKANCSSLAK